MICVGHRQKKMNQSFVWLEDNILSHGPNRQLHQYTSISKGQNITRRSKRKYIWVWLHLFFQNKNVYVYISHISKQKNKKHRVNAFCHSGKKSAYIIHTKKCIVKKEAIHHTFKKLYIQRSCLLIVYCWVKHLPDIS